jgi:hypothetical protein
VGGSIYDRRSRPRLFKKRSHNNKKNSYFGSAKLIPEPVPSILDEEYIKTINLPVQKRSMVLPEC